MKIRIAIILLTAGVVAGASALFWVLREPPPAPDRAPAPVAPAPKAEAPPPEIPSAPSISKRAKPAAPPPAPEVPPAPVAPTTGTLVIESDVPETSVFIDRVYLGSAPITADNLTPGPHRLNMSASGYDAISETIEVAAGTRTVSIKFKEIKLDEQIAVTHKHAMGSCAGTLRASPQGLTYDTSNKNDAFAAPLTALESFDVDYLKKILKVKVRGGKSYTFADPDGKIDRLYLFHQTVDKVRQRIASGR